MTTHRQDFYKAYGTLRHHGVHWAAQSDMKVTMLAAYLRMDVSVVRYAQKALTDRQIPPMLSRIHAYKVLKSLGDVRALKKARQLRK